MGCCSCKFQCGEKTESEVSQVILKIVEENARVSPIPEPKMSPIKQEEGSVIKPDSFTQLTHANLNSADVSRIGHSLSYRLCEDVIQEGELQKYRPGFTKQFITRWCILTPENFMYFKNQAAAQIWGKPPLLCVPLSEIKAVSKTNFKIAEVGEKSDQFEIFLKDEDFSVKLSREAEKTPLMRSIIDKASVNTEKRCVVKGMLMKRPLRHDSPEKGDGDSQPITSERVSWSIRELEWFASEKRLLFIAESALERDFWILNLMRACNLNK